MLSLRLATLPPLLLLLALGVRQPLASQTVRYRTDSAQEKPPFDLEEATDLMAIGETTLTGQASMVHKQSRIQIRPGTKLYPREEVVYLYPMTRFLRTWVERHAKQGLFYGKFSLQPELDRVAARTITDMEGRFRFRGLKPGQYLLWVVIPYEMEGLVEQETGQWQTTTYSWNGIVTAAVREPVTRLGTQVRKLDNHVIHVVTVPSGQSTVDLGEIQGENARLK